MPFPIRDGSAGYLVEVEADDHDPHVLYIGDSRGLLRQLAAVGREGRVQWIARVGWRRPNRLKSKWRKLSAAVSADVSAADIPAPAPPTPTGSNIELPA
jgi:hypothetical protein